MRVYSEPSNNYIKALTASISKDPASLENWNCLHIESGESEQFEEYENILDSLKEAHKELDCDIVHCTDNDIFFVSKQLNKAQLHEIASKIPTSKAEVYDLFLDWQAVRNILISKTENENTAISKPSIKYHFGDIESLKEVFSDAKKIRKSRMPLHVMIVEDDPLTRRIVTSGFKENYAIITAENAQEAVANYLLHAPDVVFLDIGLPDTNGFDVLRQIIDCDKDAYVVMFSANSYLDNINSALDAGAMGFIAKPFKKEKMNHYIQDSALHHRKMA